ncbi:MAG: HD domain-containing protein [Fusobacteriaceae bacterium]|jgi:HD-GYP domain-containing protein (c-di-GMP phosphodiesterase class II)|nr:HD domain-containing protein [Fusobacteriaceae bacterium]MBP6467435.1 HD domain-containing protein [Fusobacteriaceae bacterium]MBP9596349.1 HD domain-containing protein [Fusobacteriaceae bacterium]MBU9917039.1 HD domain-containing protein [Fusobacteriaceae bacterium]
MSDFSKLSKNLNKQNIDKISLLTRFNFLVSSLKESVFLDEKKSVYFNREINHIISDINSLIKSFSSVFYIIHLNDNPDLYIYEHTIKSSVLAGFLGSSINLSEENINILIKSSLLKDIGILRVSDKILNKKNSLEDSELLEIQKHPLISYSIIKDYENMEKEVCELVLTHHEKEDGSGYPLGLTSKEIKIESKIILISDIFTAMTSERVYSKKLSPFIVLEKFYNNSFDKFHMGIILKFLDLYSDYSLNQSVLLNNGIEGIIVSYEKSEYLRPTIQLKNGSYLNLKNQLNLYIDQYL